MFGTRIGLSILRSSTFGLADDDQRRARLALEQASMAARVAGWCRATMLALAVAGREHLKDAGDACRDDADPHENSAVLDELAPQQIKRADRSHHERAGDHRAAHVVEVLPERPRIQDQPPEARQLH